MDRREFLAAAGYGGGAVALGGGLYGRMRYRRGRFAGTLLRDARPVLIEKAHGELQGLPADAREDIRTWFHVPCRNAADFVRFICSHSFAEHLAACETDELKRWSLVNAFLSRVVSEAEILNRVQIIAEEAGAELDRNWADCCTAIAAKWNVQMAPYGGSITDDLTTRLEPIIASHIAAVIRQGQAATERPALGDTVGAIGESALMLLPLRIGLPNVVIPLFVFAAMGHLYRYVMGQLTNRVGDYQRAITARVALLGNRIGAEFETEIRARISALHVWQESALNEAATGYARETIGII